jgi:hypothetical protein
MRSRSSGEIPRLDAISYSSRLHLAEPLRGRDALDRAPDAAVEPVGDALGEHVHLKAEVAAAANQVAERTCPEFNSVTVTASSTMNAARPG